MNTAFDFACPSCAAPGKARVDWAGRSVRCKHCKAVFVLPTPGEAMADAYDLVEPIEPTPSPIALASVSDSGGTTFTPAYRDAPLLERDRNPPPLRLKKAVNPQDEVWNWTTDPRVRVLAGLIIAGGCLAVLTFAMPRLTLMGGWSLIGTGLIMVAIGFFVGAYAAFCEDFLHGMAYLFIPIYTGYYLVSRFDDLWPFFSVQTIGFLMFLIGTKALELGGAF